MPAVRRHWLILLSALIGLVPVAGILLRGESIGAFDQIFQLSPWNGPKPGQPWDVLQADSALQFYAWRELVLTSWSQFRVPVWNPYELMGTPLLANSQSGALYPFHILLGILQIPVSIAVVLLAWFHLGLAAYGAARIVRALGGDELGQSVAAAGFGGSTFLLAWAALPSVISTVAWIPITLALLLERPANPARQVLATAFCMMCLITAGHLQFVAYGGIAIAIVLFGALVRDRKAGLIGLAGVLLGGVCALPHLLPILDYSQFSHRRGSPTAEGYAAYNASALQPYHLANLVSPTALGNPRVNGPAVSEEVFASEYWPAIAHRGMNFAEGALTFGPLIVAFLVFVPWRRRAAWLFGGVLLIAALMAFGSPLNAVLYFNFPGWSATGSPGRVIVLLVLAASVLAGLGASRVSSATDIAGTKKVLLALIPVVLGLVIILPLANSGIGESVVPVVREYAQSAFVGGIMTAFPAVALVLVLCFVLTMPDAKQRAHGALGCVLLLAVSGPLAFNPIMSGKPDLPATNGVESDLVRNAFINEDWDLLVAAPAALPPNLATRQRMLETGGYDSLIHRDTVKILNDINGQDSAPPANGNMMFVKPTADPARLREAGVASVWSRRPIPQLGDYESVPEAGLVRHTIPDSQLADVDGEPAELVSVSTGGFTVKVPKSGKLTVRFRRIGPWTANVPLTGNGPWLEADVPEGVSEVSFQTGYGGQSLVGMILLALIGLGILFQRPAK